MQMSLHLFQEMTDTERLSLLSSLDAGQDKENISKTYAMSHESSPRVPSLNADEGSMQQRLHELMKLCTSLQRQQSQMADKIKDQDIEISRLKARVKSLEDKERRREEPIQEDAPITWGIIDIREGLGADKSTKKGSNDTKEMVNMLSSMEAANILSSGGIDRSNEVIAKHLSEYEQAKADLSVGEKIELISELVKYHDYLAEILKYQAQQSKPSSKKEKRKFYMSFLKIHAGGKTKHFRGMTLEQIKEKFIPFWKHMQDFVPMSLKEESEKVKRSGIKLDQGSSKRMKISHTSRLEPSQEQQFKGSKSTRDKEKELWVELKRLFEPDSEDQLWTYHQAFMHNPLD
nr:hypothetical protein [Tanacetum cinerariifolium]